MRVMLKTLACAAVIGLGAMGLGATPASAALDGKQLSACEDAGQKGDLQALDALVSQDTGQASALVKCFVLRNKGLAVQAALVGAMKAPGREIDIAVAATEANPAAASAIYGAIAGLKTFRGNPVELALALSQVSGVSPDQISQINTQRDILIAPAAGGGGQLAGPGPTEGGAPGSGDNPNITEGNAAVSASTL